MTATPPEPAPAPAAPDHDAPLASRVDGLEAEQQRQGGVLDEIKGLLTSRPQGDPPVTSADPVPPGDMAEQMRQAVRDVQAEAAATVKDKPAAPEPETTPREVMIKGKERLQRALFGGDK